MHCENPYCKKDGLTKKDVHLNPGTAQLYCTECMRTIDPTFKTADAPIVPEQVLPPKPQVKFSININNEGVVAKVTYDKATLTLEAPISTFTKLLDK